MDDQNSQKTLKSQNQGNEPNQLTDNQVLATVQHSVFTVNILLFTKRDFNVKEKFLIL